MSRAFMNPLGLKIGQEISVRAYSTLEYDDKGNRRVVKHDTTANINGKLATMAVTVCCCVVRCTGKVIQGSSGFDYDGGSQTEFKTEKRIAFYECRDTIDSKPFLIHPEDIVLETL
jgi:hypothetical protein